MRQLVNKCLAAKKCRREMALMNLLVGDAEPLSTKKRLGTFTKTKIDYLSMQSMRASMQVHLTTSRCIASRWRQEEYFSI